VKEIELLKIIFKDSPDILEPLNEIDKENKRLHSIIKETSEDLHQVVKWCTENKHNEDTIERYLVVDYGTIVGKINEIRTKLDKENK
jgi:hypothetical protein